MSDAVEEDTRLAKDCESEDAVDWSWDCIVLLFDLVSLRDSGLESVLSRRMMPETAYETGYVKYEDERFGVDRREGGVEGR